MATTERVLNLSASAGIVHTTTFSDEAYVAMGLYSCIVGTVSVCGNVLVLMVMLENKRAYKFYNVLIINMAVSDLLNVSIKDPLTAPSRFSKRWLFSIELCYFTAVLESTCSMVNVDTQLFIAVFRYYLISKHSSNVFATFRTALYIVAFSWAHSVLWTSLPLFGFSKYILEPYQTECSIDWIGNTPQELGYLFTTVVLYFAVPVVLALLFYTLVMKESKISGRSRHCPNGPIRLEDLLWRHMILTERGVNRMFAVMMGTNMACWVPFLVMSSISASGAHIAEEFTPLPTMCAHLRCIANPLIYAAMSPEFRSGVRVLFSRCRCLQAQVAASGQRRRSSVYRLSRHRSRLADFGSVQRVSVVELDGTELG